MKKIYLVMMQYSTDDCDGVDTECFDTYEKAVNRYNQMIEDEKNPNNSWAANAFDNDILQNDYNLDCSPIYSDGQEHELWWNITCELDWYLHTFIELRILEVQ